MAKQGIAQQNRKNKSNRRISILIFLLVVVGMFGITQARDTLMHPNILWIYSDDHAQRAISAYGGPLARLAPTPNLDRLAEGGMLFTHSFVTNSICGPSRAVILTGKHSHINGFRKNDDMFDGGQATFPKLLQQGVYQTALVGKWHLRSDPEGFDHWEILPGQGHYYNPDFVTPAGRKTEAGYVTDVITDKAMAWIQNRNPQKPFMLMMQHKAPHREWMPRPKYLDRFEGVEFPEPENLFDGYRTRGSAARDQDMSIEHTMNLTGDNKVWELEGNTIACYSSDQGFYLGEHGWFDKRFMYEESMRTPLLIAWPGHTPPGSRCDKLVQNLDYAQTFLEMAGVSAPGDMQGRSLVPLLRGQSPAWRKSLYCHYYEGEHSWHRVAKHYGIRTEQHKLIHFYTLNEWELYDLQHDPYEMNNLVHNRGHTERIVYLQEQLASLRRHYQVPLDPSSNPVN